MLKKRKEKSPKDESPKGELESVDTQTLLARAVASSAEREAILRKTLRDKTLIIYVLAGAVLVMAIYSITLLRIKTPTDKAFFYIDPVSGRPVAMKPYDLPILTEPQMRQRLADTISELGALSFYNRSQILTRIRPQFYKPVYEQLLTDLSKDAYLNPTTMADKKISTSTVVKDLRLLSQEKVGNPQRLKEIWGAHVVTTFRSYGNIFQTKDYYQYLTVVRGDPNKIPGGYQIVKRVESSSPIRIEEVKK